MKISDKSKEKRFFPLMLVAAVLCSFVTVLSYRSGVSFALADVCGAIVSPMQKGAANVRAAAQKRQARMADMDALQQENQTLKEENRALIRKVSELTPLKEENEALRGYLGLKQEKVNLSLIDARIIARNVSAYTSLFTVDKGSVDGVKKDMAVLSSDKSVLGIITEVGATYARGKILTSYDLSIGVRNERTGESALLSGSFALSKQNKCRIGSLDETADYRMGDILRTSSLSDIYPAGLYVGEVEAMLPDELDGTWNAVIKPSETVFDSDYVMIVQDFDRETE